MPTNTPTPTNPFAASMTLAQSKRIALGLLLVMVCIWLLLLWLAKTQPSHGQWINILVLGAEAGMVGGLADWYAITVLFRDPFKWVWMPSFIRKHTAIIPRNQPRIAWSMGRFVQENFLAPDIVSAQVSKHDVSLYIANWLNSTDNSTMLTREFQKLTPRLLHILDNPEVSAFMRSTTLEWVHSTQLNKPIAQVMHAMFNNGLHKDVFQLILDTTNRWVQNNPQETDRIIDTVIEQTGIFALVPKAASMLGIDIKKMMIAAIIKSLEEVSQNSDHPMRKVFSDSINLWTYALADDSSEASQLLRSNKDAMLQNTTIINFLAEVTHQLRSAIIHDLEQPESGIGRSLQSMIVHMAKQLQSNLALRQALNTEILALCRYLSERYADTVVNYIQQQIINWDTKAMINKIENEVGADLQMIRVNGVLVGSAIGLVLGSFRWLIE